MEFFERHWNVQNLTLFQSKTLSDRSTVKNRGFRPTGFCPTPYTGTPLKTNGAWGGCAPPHPPAPNTRPTTTKDAQNTFNLRMLPYYQVSTPFDTLRNFPKFSALAPPLTAPGFSIEFIMGFPPKLPPGFFDLQDLRWIFARTT